MHMFCDYMRSTRRDQKFHEMFFHNLSHYLSMM